MILVDRGYIEWGRLKREISSLGFPFGYASVCMGQSYSLVTSGMVVSVCGFVCIDVLHQSLSLDELTVRDRTDKMRIISTERGYFHKMRIFSTNYRYIPR